jgi:ferredoxin
MLGKTAPNPVISTLKFFRDEYNAHVYDKYCPTGNCEALQKFKILLDKCKECGLCKKKCPVEAIEGERKVTQFKVIPEKCIKCGVCVEACKFDAVIKG